MKERPMNIVRNSKKDFTCFRSGMSSKSDLRGAIDAGVPVGTVAGKLTTTQQLLALPKYLDQGGKVFIDSGAFCAKNTGVQIDWESVIVVYERVAELTRNAGNLWVVSPDVMGDQAKTLSLIRQWAARINGLIGEGCNVIVPLQLGSMSGALMIEEVNSILGHSQWVAGIPSVKNVMSSQECETLRHGSFHILGRVQMDEEQEARISALLKHNEGAVITADANWLRSRLSIIRGRAQREEIGRRTSSFSPMHLDHPRAAAVAGAILSDQTWGIHHAAI
jgi:hypothetical protein